MPHSRSRLLTMPMLPLLAVGLLLQACGPTEAAEPLPSDVGEVRGEETTSTVERCQSPEVALPDGSCFRPGIPPDGCGAGFEHDGEYGCEPTVPKDACPPGLMAVPGDIACRPVMPCGQGRWGDLPVDATTQYVDKTYAGSNKDGSSERPWTAIKRAYQAAQPDALIAIAEGIYPEQIILKDKPVRLWGVCPEKVRVVGNGQGHTIGLYAGTEGTEIGGIAITSAGLGLGVTETLDITIDRVWIHDTVEPALFLLGDPGRASAHVMGSLIEGARHYAILAAGSDLNLSDSVLRNTLAPLIPQVRGGGLGAHMLCDDLGCDTATRPKIEIAGCVIEESHNLGTEIIGGDLSLKDSVVRTTRPRVYDQKGGEGLRLQIPCDWAGRCYLEEPALATISGSLIENNHTSAIYLASSRLELATTVVRHTQPQPYGQEQGTGLTLHGYCGATGCKMGSGSVATVRNTLLESNHTAQALVAGSTATFEGTVLRGTLPRQKDSRLGMAIQTQHACNEGAGCSTLQPGVLTMSGCLIADNQEAGILALNSMVRLTSLVIRNTAAQQSDALHGDGIVIMSDGGTSTGLIEAISIEQSTRAGIANFGSDVSIKGSRISCAAFPLAGDTYRASPFRFEDAGNNLCGCPDPTNVCKAVSASLEPPDPRP